jgi:hypothetical protein
MKAINDTGKAIIEGVTRRWVPPDRSHLGDHQFASSIGSTMCWAYGALDDVEYTTSVDNAKAEWARAQQWPVLVGGCHRRALGAWLGTSVGPPWGSQSTTSGTDQLFHSEFRIKIGFWRLS